MNDEDLRMGVVVWFEGRVKRWRIRMLRDDDALRR